MKEREININFKVRLYKTSSSVSSSPSISVPAGMRKEVKDFIRHEVSKVNKDIMRIVVESLFR